MGAIFKIITINNAEFYQYLQDREGSLALNDFLTNLISVPTGFIMCRRGVSAPTNQSPILNDWLIEYNKGHTTYVAIQSINNIEFII